MYNYSSQGGEFLHSVVFESIYASFESSCWDFQSISMETSMFIKSGFMEQSANIVVHANSSPLLWMRFALGAS